MASNSGFSIWEFTSKEVSQIIDLVDCFEAGQSRPIDRRCYSRQVLEYAVSVDLLRPVCKHGVFSQPRERAPEWTGDCSRCTRRSDWRLAFCNGMQFMPEYDLPPAVLWHYVRNMLYHPTGEVRGYSLSQQKGWRTLGLWENGHRWHTEKHRESMFQILCNLASHRYIIFQAAGSVWQITVLDHQEL